MNYFYCFIFSLFLNAYSYVLHPVNLIGRNIKNLGEFQVYEPHNILKKEMDCLLFYSGGNNLIHHEIYSNFLYKIASKKFAIYVIPFQYKKTHELINFLENEYNEVIPFSHSSGSTTLIQQLANKKQIRKAIFIDPVDSRINRIGQNQLYYMKNILFIRAEKSYIGKPIPFIPNFLELNENNIIVRDDCNVYTINSLEHGHCDLLNPFYSNIISNTQLKYICDSATDRSLNNLNNYIDFLSNSIYEFINQRTINEYINKEYISKSKYDGNSKNENNTYTIENTIDY